MAHESPETGRGEETLTEISLTSVPNAMQNGFLFFAAFSMGLSEISPGSYPKSPVWIELRGMDELPLQFQVLTRLSSLLAGNGIRIHPRDMQERGEDKGTVGVVFIEVPVRALGQSPGSVIEGIMAKLATITGVDVHEVPEGVVVIDSSGPTILEQRSGAKKRNCSSPPILPAPPKPLFPALPVPTIPLDDGSPLFPAVEQEKPLEMVEESTVEMEIPTDVEPVDENESEKIRLIEAMGFSFTGIALSREGFIEKCASVPVGTGIAFFQTVTLPRRILMFKREFEPGTDFKREGWNPSISFSLSRELDSYYDLLLDRTMCLLVKSIDRSGKIQDPYNLYSRSDISEKHW